MEFNLETIVFYFLAAFISVFSILTVTTRRMVRSATYLLFVLFGTAGIYFLLGVYRQLRKQGSYQTYDCYKQQRTMV